MDSTTHLEPIRAPDDTGGNLIGSGLKCQREIGTMQVRKHLNHNDLREVTCVPPRVQIRRHECQCGASVCVHRAESQQQRSAFISCTHCTLATRAQHAIEHTHEHTHEHTREHAREHARGGATMPRDARPSRISARVGARADGASATTRRHARESVSMTPRRATPRASRPHRRSAPTVTVRDRP